MSVTAELTLADALDLVRVTRAGAEHLLSISPEALRQLEAAGVVEFDPEDGQAPITSLVGGMFRESCVIALQAADVVDGAREMAIQTSSLVCELLKRLEADPDADIGAELPKFFLELAAVFERAAPRIYAPIGTPPREAA